MGIFDYTVYGKVTDEKGRGIAGVSVTDGRIVVETDTPAMPLPFSSVTFPYTV